jgi:arylsulfatase A-like enzyme
MFTSPASGLGTQKPNILLILADDPGWRDTATCGSTFYDTPNVGRLAQRGMRFTNGYAANPVCSPTRVGILTGQYPARP